MDTQQPPFMPLDTAATCRWCGMGNAAENIQCRSCGRPLGMSAPRVDSARHARPLWQLGLFVVLSFGLYLLPWSNRCWRFCNEAWAAAGVPTRRSPWGRSLTFLIPLCGWFYSFYRLAADVQDAAGDTGDIGPGALNAIFIGSWIAAKLLPGFWTALALLGVLGCILPIQAQINRFCERDMPGVTARRRLGWQAIVGIIVGVMFWVAVVFGVTYLNRESTGIATLSFGHGVDTSAMAVEMSATRFGHNDHIVWMAHLNGRLGETQVLRTIDLQTGGALQRVATDKLTTDNADVANLYEENDMPNLASAPLDPGTYLVRFWRSGAVIAQGTFTLVN
jgi:hypothetical protein